MYLKHSTFETKGLKISVKLFTSYASCKVIPLMSTSEIEAKLAAKQAAVRFPFS